MTDDGWRELMAAVARRAMQDVEEAHKIPLRLLLDAHERTSTGRPRPHDADRLARWDALNVATAVSFFKDGMWEHVAHVLDVDYTGLSRGFRQRLRQVAHRARRLDEVRREGVA